VRDHEAVAARLQLVGGVVEDVERAVVERRFEQQPLPAGRALGQDAQLGVREVGPGRDLPAGAQAERNQVRVQRGLQLTDTVGDRGDVDEVDVRRTDDEARAVLNGQAGKLERGLEVGGAVVDGGQKVEVEFEADTSSEAGPG
jgi:hypothetical protein